MNWSDKRYFSLRFIALLSALVAAAGVALCPTGAQAEKAEEKPEAKEKGKKEKKKDKEKNKGKEKKDKKKKKKDDEDDEKNDLANLFPIPVGHGGGGIKIPQMDEHGRLQMTFEIGSAFREDETQLKMENLKIETFDALGKLDMVVEMPKSTMNLKTRVLTSVDPIQIERPDLKLVGGNVTFNTQTRFGTFKGPVRMLIFNRSNL